MGKVRMNHKTSMYCMIHTISTDGGFQIIMIVLELLFKSKQKLFSYLITLWVIQTSQKFTLPPHSYLQRQVNVIRTGLCLICISYS